MVLLIMSIAILTLSAASSVVAVGAFATLIFGKYDKEFLISGIVFTISTCLFLFIGLDIHGDRLESTIYDKPIVEKIEVRNGKANIYIKDIDVVIRDGILCLKKENIWIQRETQKDGDVKSYIICTIKDMALRSGSKGGDNVK